MTPDDPRHGTTTGYRIGCREACCRRAIADSMAERRKRLYLSRSDSLSVPNLGTRRRLQALVALGWPLSEISRRAGYQRSHAALILNRGRLQASTAARFAAIYDELSMQLPPTDTPNQRTNVGRARNTARRNGWLPPLAWDDIDDPNERPQLTDAPRSKTDLDHAVVERVIRGERLSMTRAERLEVVRRLRDDWGWSEERIETHTGISKSTNRDRYPTRPQEDAA